MAWRNAIFAVVSILVIVVSILVIVVSLLVIKDRTQGTGRSSMASGSLATMVGIAAGLITTIGGSSASDIMHLFLDSPVSRLLPSHFCGSRFPKPHRMTMRNTPITNRWLLARAMPMRHEEPDSVWMDQVSFSLQLEVNWAR